jgi:gamma-glutamyltranspeptidase/glutathione hydrolase
MIVRLLLALTLLLTPVSAWAAGVVVSAADPRAAEAGRDILRAGGSATDAAMAMMLALTVVEPQSSGIGGGGFLLHHDAGTEMIGSIDGRETAPASARSDQFLNLDGTPMNFVDAMAGGRSVGVPGNIALMAEAHRRWGRLPWARLFEPAIRLAEDGFEVTPRLAAAIAARRMPWTDPPEVRALYWDNGAPLHVGSRVRNHSLAATLRRIAARGPEEFYRGETAQAIAAAVTNAPHNPVQLTLNDLAGYGARTRPPVCARYRVWRICGMGPPSSGATTVLGILGMLERFNLRRLGSRNPRAWHLIGEAMRLAYADRDLYLGDRDFVDVPVAGLIDPGYLRARSRLIDSDRARGHYPPGNPPGAEPRAALAQPDEQGTTHFVAVDGDGNVASMTSTIETSFGSQLFAAGMVLNNELTDFAFAPERAGSPAANRVEPGKRPLSSMSPTIVYDAEGRIVLALGSAGGRRIIMHVVKTLVGVLDWGLDAQAAIELPNIFFDDTTLVVEEGTFLGAMAPQLQDFGHTVEPVGLASKVNAIARAGDGWTGAADRRSEGVALVE